MSYWKEIFFLVEYRILVLQRTQVTLNKRVYTYSRVDFTMIVRSSAYCCGLGVLLLGTQLE